MFKDRSTTVRKRIRFHDEDTPDENGNEMNEAEEAHTRKHIFYSFLDHAIGGLTVCFSTEKDISDTFSFLWNHQKMSKEELKRKAAKLAVKYSEDLVQEMNHIRMVHNVNFGRKQLDALELLNALTEYML